MRSIAFCFCATIALLIGCDSDDGAAGRPKEGSANFTILNDENFAREVFDEPRPVLVAFGAPWCPICTDLKPVLARLAGTYTGRVKFARLNIDENAFASEKYAIHLLPTLILFEGGTAVGRIEGRYTADDVEALIVAEQRDRGWQPCPAGKSRRGEAILEQISSQ